MSDELPLLVGGVYRAKRPRRVGSITGSGWNDRVILWVSPSGEVVQYDGPAVKMGRQYPRVSASLFRAWAGSIVSEPMGEVGCG